MTHKFKVGELVMFDQSRPHLRPLPRLHLRLLPRPRLEKTYGIITQQLDPKEIFYEEDLKMVEQQDQPYTWFSQSEQQEFVVFEDEIEKVK